MKQRQILLDMDGVLSNFVEGAIGQLNRELATDLTVKEYVQKGYGWNMWEPYEITPNAWWSLLEKDPNIWSNLKPFPWAKQLYNKLKEFGEVTILTAPSENPYCAAQKIGWLYGHLGINSSSVMIGSRKYLMAGNGILIDDYPKNVKDFTEAGGEGIVVPSNWNTLDLTFDKVWAKIDYYLKMKDYGTVDRTLTRARQ
jgi:5'(3')-deoxyribonucleotidase